MATTNSTQFTEEMSAELVARLGSEFFTLRRQDIVTLLEDLRVMSREKCFSAETLNRCPVLLVDYAARGFSGAQKVLSNLIMNYQSIRAKIVDSYVECARERLYMCLARYNDDSDEELKSIFLSNEHEQELLYYDFRILFLLSATCPESRELICRRLCIQLVNVLYHKADEINRDHDYQVIIEGTKVLFNLTLNSEDDIILFNDLVNKLLDVTYDPDLTEDSITCFDDFHKETSKPMYQVFIHILQILTNMPKEVYAEICDRDQDRILDHLKLYLIYCPPSDQQYFLMPALSVCASICKHDEDTRERWFEEILQSREGFELRPEEYQDTRGRIVKLMTNVDVYIKELAADFLFSLCSDDTEKFITYTGLGNSAGFLSTKGLLGASVKRSNKSQRDPMFRELAEKLDPITGKLETPKKKNPIDEMTQEEKEYHAEQLANAITKLSNLGIVKPMFVDDGNTLSNVQPGSSNQTEKKD